MFCLSSKHGISSVPCIVWSTVSMSFYCRNAYFVLGVPNSSYYSDPASRSTPRLRINENPHQLWLSGWETTPCWGAKEKRGARGAGLFSRAFGLHWALSCCPSFPNEGCTRQSGPSAVARKQDHCIPGEVSCWNGQYLWHKLTRGLKVSNSIVALCRVGLKANKGKLTLTLRTTGRPSIGCSISVWRDQGWTKDWCPVTLYSPQTVMLTLCS